MNTKAPTLSPLFRSDAQAEILSRLILNPDRSYTTAELARVTHSPYATAHREVQRLVQSGLFLEDHVGQAIRLTANTRSPLYSPVSELLRLSYGPAAVVPRLLEGISGIEESYIYGSWAARRSGEIGDAPGDIDILIVGKPSRSEISDASEKAERTLGREVNIRIVPRSVWEENTDLFVKTVRERPLFRLDV